MAAPWIVDDGLGELVAPLLPPWPTRAPGPRPVEDWRCLQPILFVLPTGIGWQDLPQQVGFGAGMTCGRRLRRWTDAGVFDRLHRILLAALHTAGALDWSRAVADAAHLRANKGAPGLGCPRSTAPARVARHHLSCDGGGLPLKVLTTGGNVTDVSTACDVVDAIPPVAGRPGRPRHRPDTLLAGTGYDSDRWRCELPRRRSIPIISYRGTKGVQGLGTLRYLVAQTLALLHQFPRLTVRFEHHLDLHQALVSLAYTLTCRRRLNRKPRSC